MKKILSITILVLIIAFLRSQSISAGNYSLVLCKDGTVQAFGLNDHGQLGDSTTINRSSPITVKGLTDIKAVSVGANHSLFLKNDGTVWACGENLYGQLGDGTKTERLVPVQVKIIKDVIAIVAAGKHSLFLKNDGTVWACGFNYLGALGDGTGANSTLPIRTINVSGIIAIAAGAHSLFLKNDGTVWSCGSSSFGQLGHDEYSYRPAQIQNLNGVVAIAAGAEHSLFLKSDGTVYGCGSNYDSQLGIPNVLQRSRPVFLPYLWDITDISAGWGHSFFRQKDGTIWACGMNGGRLGDGSFTEQTIPVKVIGMDAVEMKGGGNHSLFVKSDGTVYGCGRNFYGQLGIPGIDSQSIAIPLNACHTSHTDTNCKAKFTLSPDLSQPHSWFAVNQTIGAAPIRYTWSWGDGKADDTIAFPTHVFDSAGYYSICLTINDARGCVHTFCDSSTYVYKTDASFVTIKVVNQLPSAIDEVTKQSLLNIYPNPVQQVLTVTFASTEQDITITNLIGEVLYYDKATGGTKEIDVSHLPSGMYFVNNRKFVKE